MICSCGPSDDFDDCFSLVFMVDDDDLVQACRQTIIGFRIICLYYCRERVLEAWRAALQPQIV